MSRHGTIPRSCEACVNVNNKTILFNDIVEAVDLFYVVVVSLVFGYMGTVIEISVPSTYPIHLGFLVRKYWQSNCVQLLLHLQLQMLMHTAIQPVLLHAAAMLLLEVWRSRTKFQFGPLRLLLNRSCCNEMDWVWPPLRYWWGVYSAGGIGVVLTEEDNSWEGGKPSTGTAMYHSAVCSSRTPCWWSIRKSRGYFFILVFTVYVQRVFGQMKKIHTIFYR